MSPHHGLRLFAAALLTLAAGCGSKATSKPDASDAGGKSEAAAEASVPDAADAPMDVPRETAAVETGAPDATEAGGAPEAGDAVSGDAADSGADAEVGADAPPSSKRYKAIAIAAGTLHNCVLLEDHRVKCWGTNDSGQLGLGDKIYRGMQASDMGNALPTVDLGTGRTAKAIAAGRYATCALLDDDTVKCWGLGSLAGRPFGAGGGNVGDDPNEMGDHLAPIELGAGRKPLGVAVGYYDACIARDNGTFRCFGTSNEPNDVPAATDGGGVVRMFHGGGALALYADGSVREVVSAATGPKLVAGGPTHKAHYAFSSPVPGGCALITGADAECWGSGAQTQAPPPFALTGAKALTFSELAGRCAIMGDGTVKCWRGKDPFGATTNPGTIDVGGPAIDLVAGLDHVCILTAAGDVKCWDSDGGPPSYAAGPSMTVAGRWDAIDLGDRPAN
jgi:prepilin-type processing-associated H-X9-DG protein